MSQSRLVPLAPTLPIMEHPWNIPGGFVPPRLTRRIERALGPIRTHPVEMGCAHAFDQPL